MCPAFRQRERDEWHLMSPRARALAAIGMAGVLWCGATVVASEPGRSITDTSIRWPTWPELARALALRDYNTRVVVLGTALLGVAAGVVGTFAYLRRRALMGDALSHATLPGIAIVFLLTGAKSMPLLLMGATISGVLGVLAVLGMRRMPRIKEDAAIGIVLSVFFGFGMVLFGLIQQMQTGNEAGLAGFIYGKAAAMVAGDARLIGVVAAVVVAACAALFKEFRVICFDQEYASSQGFRVPLIDLIMMGLVVMTTVVGLQAVGLILIVALLIIPAAAARFWTDDLLVMVALSGLFGGMSSLIGATLSAIVSGLPTGAMIVLCAGVFFFFSMLIAPRRGVIASAARHWLLRRRVAYQHLLRALAEYEETHGEGAAIGRKDLFSVRSWSAAQVRRTLARAVRSGDLAVLADGSVRLTQRGRVEALRILRNHRLWELYLIRHADVAPSHVDRDADEVEHVLSEAIVRDLERALDEVARVPPSPHVREPAP